MRDFTETLMLLFLVAFGMGLVVLLFTGPTLVLVYGLFKLL
jgi:hypothetical protein